MTWLRQFGVRRLVREPLTHFLLLGSALFLLYSAVDRDPSSAVAGSIHIDDAELKNLAAGWQARTGRWPTAEEVAYLVDARVRRELLFREALALDLHLDDAATRMRLAAQLEGRWRDAAGAVAPSEGQLRAHFEANRTLYRDPMQLTFSHRFFAHSDTGAGRKAEATAALDRLRSGREVITDEHDGARTLTLRSEERVADRFGPGFNQRVLELADQGFRGQWFGPIESPAGWHVVRIDGYRSADPLTFEQARLRVESDWRREFVSREVESRLTALRSRYTVHIDAFDQIVAKVAD